MVLRQPLAIAAFVLLSSSCAPSPNLGPIEGSFRSAGLRCEALRNRDIGGGAKITSAELVPALSGASQLCVMQAAFAGSALRMEVRLPAAGWNERLLFLGGGGFDGLLTPPMEALSQSSVNGGYATATTNGGHDTDRSKLSYFDAEFAFDPQKLADFTTNSEHRALGPAKAVIAAFYGRSPKRSYYEGCSMGGHDALILAQRYPKDFDGIIARAPAGNVVGLFAQFNRVANAVEAPGGNLSSAKRFLLANSVLAQCDALDKLTDRIISNPAACKYDPVTIRCNGGVDTGDTCLSDQQISTIRAMTTGRSWGSDGWITHPGYNNGGEDADAWNYVWPTPAFGGKSLQRLFSDGFVRAFVTRDRNFDTSSWDPVRWKARLDEIAARFQAVDPNLRPFHARGGKLILWNGTNDTSVSARDTARYYQSAVAHLGLRRAAETVEYFEAPGVGHCFGGAGPDKVDLLPALDKWVEDGVSPSRQNLSHIRVGSAPMSRPLCKYPTYPRYSGFGDVTSAGSFSCEAPVAGRAP